MMTRHLLPLLLATSAVGACAVGPDYRPPLTPTTAQQDFQGATSPAVSTAAAQDRWWRLYNDPLLDRLVEDALAANTDIRVAVVRIDKARAQLRGARSDRLPQTDIGASAALRSHVRTRNSPFSTDGITNTSSMKTAACDTRATPS